MHAPRTPLGTHTASCASSRSGKTCSGRPSALRDTQKRRGAAGTSQTRALPEKGARPVVAAGVVNPAAPLQRALGCVRGAAEGASTASIFFIEAPPPYASPALSWAKLAYVGLCWLILALCWPQDRPRWPQDAPSCFKLASSWLKLGPTWANLGQLGLQKSIFEHFEAQVGSKNLQNFNIYKNFF